MPPEAYILGALATAFVGVLALIGVVLTVIVQMRQFNFNAMSSEIARLTEAEKRLTRDVAKLEREREAERAAVRNAVKRADAAEERATAAEEQVKKFLAAVRTLLRFIKAQGLTPPEIDVGAPVEA